MSNLPIAISIKNLTKIYRLYESPQQRLREALHPFRKKYHQEFMALENISFDVPKGQTMGILGRNGSGKSTLLQLMCGIMQPSSGTVSTNGKVSALLELGAGFNPEFTGRDNVYMNGALMGFTRAQIDVQMPYIEDFADIGEFIDQPTKTYSSGMYIRLAFSCAINVKPDILIIDEALSVGDVFFQQKCFRKIREIIAGGTTCIFVSHDTQAVMNLCDSALLLRNGKLDFIGTPEEAVSRYYSCFDKRDAPKALQSTDLTTSRRFSSVTRDIITQRSIIPKGVTRYGDGGLKIIAAMVTDCADRETLEVEMMGTLRFYLLIKAEEDIFEPSTGIQLYDRLGNLVYAAGTRQIGVNLPDLKCNQELIVNMEIRFTVQAGEYTFSLGTSQPSDNGPNVGFIQDRIESLGPISVSCNADGVMPFYGIAQLSHKVSYDLLTQESHDSALL